MNRPAPHRPVPPPNPFCDAKRTPERSNRIAEPELPTMGMSQAINTALADAMADDDRVLVFGEDVAREGGVFRVTAGSRNVSAPQRCFDTPLAESAIVGVSIGLAIRGYRPVPEIQFDGFVYPALDQIISHLAKYRSRTEGAITLPVTFRVPSFGGIGAADRHSDSIETYLVHTAGIQVVSPSTPDDAYWLLRHSIDADDPVVFLEPKRRYWNKGVVDRDTAGTRHRPGGRSPPGRRRHRGDLRRPGRRGAARPRRWPRRTTTSRWRSSTCDRSHRSTSRRSQRRCGGPSGVSSCTRPPAPSASAPRSPPGCRRSSSGTSSHRCCGSRVSTRRTPRPDLKAAGSPTPIDCSTPSTRRSPSTGSRPSMSPACDIGPRLRRPRPRRGARGRHARRLARRVGDEVALNQPLCMLETAKAEVEIPSPFAGRVVECNGEPGDTLDVGTVLARIEVAGASPIAPVTTDVANEARRTTPAERTSSGTERRPGRRVAGGRQGSGGGRPSVDPLPIDARHVDALPVDAAPVDPCPSSNEMPANRTHDPSARTPGRSPRRASWRATSRSTSRRCHPGSGTDGRSRGPTSSPQQTLLLWCRTALQPAFCIAEQGYGRGRRGCGRTGSRSAGPDRRPPHGSAPDDPGRIGHGRGRLCPPPVVADDVERRRRGWRSAGDYPLLPAAAPAGRRGPPSRRSTRPTTTRSDRHSAPRDVHLGVATATDRGLVVPVVRAAQQRSVLDLSTEVRRLASAARTARWRRPTWSVRRSPSRTSARSASMTASRSSMRPRPPSSASARFASGLWWSTVRSFPGRRPRSRARSTTG